VTGAQLLTTLARRLNKNTTLDSATEARLLDFLNESYREVLSKPGMERLRRSTTTFDSVAGTATYTVSSAARVLRVWETTNDRRLWEMTIDQYRTIEPDPSANTGTPEAFVWMGVPAVSSNSLALWPTPASVITYTCEILSVLTDLANDANSPLLPLDFHDVLVYGAESREYEKLDDSRLTVAQARYEKRIKQLQYWLAETDTGTVSLPNVVERSLFNGGWYPGTRSYR
jgi:hypothetical protein